MMILSNIMGTTFLPFKQTKKSFSRAVVRPTNRQMLMRCMLFILGVLFGVYLNYYGLVFERITIEMHIFDHSQNRLDRSKHLNVNGTDGFHIPNIVHFIWFGKNKEMSFINYISILSAHKVQKPDSIMFHCNNLPTGAWWERLWRKVPLKIVHREPPTEIHGQRLLHKYHQGDIAKFELLMEYGGIYLDYDVIVVNSLNPLRKYEITLGREKPPKFNAGVIVAHKDAVYLRAVYQSYRDNYRPLDWDYNCARLPYQIYRQHPEMVHVEYRRLTTPDWTERHLLWNKVIDWSDLYVIHIMDHMNWEEYDPDKIRHMNSTFGEVARFIYYGSKRMLK